MHNQGINSAARTGMIGLSLLMLLLVLTGYTMPPQQDENAAAHIFQLAALALVPTALLFLASADWQRPRRNLLSMGVSAVLVLSAFASLYYLEHFWYLRR